MIRKGPIAHTTRQLSRRHPIHVVMTLVRGAPPAHRRQVREIFHHWLGVARDRYGLCFSFGTMMPDHIHLVCESPRTSRDLSNGLRFVCSKVALAINRAFDRKGPLFADRYFSRILKTPSELLNALLYVARNPVAAGLCARPEDWRAGAARDYVHGSECPSLWGFHGYFFKILGFYDDPHGAFLDVLSGKRRPQKPSTGRQLRLPFARGLPRPA
jgi:hypothetical protein